MCSCVRDGGVACRFAGLGPGALARTEGGSARDRDPGRGGAGSRAAQRTARWRPLRRGRAARRPGPCARRLRQRARTMAGIRTGLAYRAVDLGHARSASHHRRPRTAGRRTARRRLVDRAGAARTGDARGHAQCRTRRPAGQTHQLHHPVRRHPRIVRAHPCDRRSSLCRCRHPCRRLVVAQPLPRTRSLDLQHRRSRER
jgi:hypothetical protein